MSGRGIINGRGRGRGQNGRSNRPVCRFFLNNSCNYGDRCRFYHPPNRTQRQCPNDNWRLTNRDAQGTMATGADVNESMIDRDIAMIGALFGETPDASANETQPTPRTRVRDLVHPAPSANVSGANRIPEDALSTRAVPPDELEDDDDILEDGEIDEEDFDSDVDYNDLYQDDAQDMEDYMHALDSDDDDFSEYGGYHFNFARHAFNGDVEGFNGDDGDEDELWDELHRGMRIGFQGARRQPGGPNNAPAAATGELNVSDIQSFATRVTQSIESKDAEIKELKDEVERLKEIIEGNDETKDARLCTLKCGVCLDIKKATMFSVNSPCGHCFCKTCNDSLRGNRDNKCPKCRAKVAKQTVIFV